ncbi:MAG: hypothetical protein LDLANPLL_01317 [Turneriella sp.]|nr:hypothetical protein [Turneriella sp.]
MKKNSTRIICLAFFIIFFVIYPTSLFADILYLKTGEVLEAVKITETNANATVILEKGKPRHIPNKDVLRVRYGQDMMEKLYIQTESDEIIEGYLVDQESDYVLIRRKKALLAEEKIPKSAISKMSNKKIVSYYSEVGASFGYRAFLNSGGSKLKPAFAPSLFYAAHPPWFTNVIVLGEVGFAEHKSVNAGQSLQVIPLSINALIFAAPWSRVTDGNVKWTKRLKTALRVGVGTALLRFTTGEGEAPSQAVFFFTLGLVEEFALTPWITLSLEARYEGLFDSAALMHSITPIFGLRYRF